MKRREVINIIYSAVLIFLTIWYSIQIMIGGIQPVLSTWLIFFLATSLGLFTYLKSGREKNFATNIANTADVLFTGMISLVLILSGAGLKKEGFDFICLGLAGWILLAYMVGRKAEKANLAVNVLMVIAYIPTIIGLWSAKSNPESFTLWGLSWLTTVLALYSAVKERDWLAALYVARATVMASIVIALMLRLQFWTSS